MLLLVDYFTHVMIYLPLIPREGNAHSMTKRKFAALTATLCLIALAVGLKTQDAPARPGLSKPVLSTPSHSSNAELESESDSNDDLADMIESELDSAPTPTASHSPSMGESADSDIHGKMTADQFQSKAESFFTHLRENSHKPDKTGHGHSAADHVVKAAEMLQKLVLGIENNPELKPEAVSFFHKCAVGTSHPDALRALCYLQLKENSPEHAQELQAQLLKEIPELAELGLDQDQD